MWKWPFQGPRASTNLEAVPVWEAMEASDHTANPEGDTKGFELKDTTKSLDVARL